MALTSQRVSEVAGEVKEVCDLVKSAFSELHELLETNSHLAIDWAGDPLPEYINEDVAGNIDGHKFSRAQVANAIGSLDQIRRLLTNQTVSQGGHLGNIDQIAEVDA